MPHDVQFKQDLHCLSCGAHLAAADVRLHTTGLSPESFNITVVPGEILDLAVDDFEDGYLTLADPGDGPIRAFEEWGCPVCKAAQWARLDFSRIERRQYRFERATSVPLTPEVLREMNFVTRWMDMWVEANPGNETDEIMRLSDI